MHSTSKEKLTLDSVSCFLLHFFEIQNPEKICWWNPESWALESGIQLNESEMLLRIDWNPECVIPLHGAI